MAEVGTEVVPQRSSAHEFFVYGLKQGTTKFLGLVDQEGQHHQHREDDRQMLLAMTEIMLEVIILIL